MSISQKVQPCNAVHESVFDKRLMIMILFAFSLMLTSCGDDESDNGTSSDATENEVINSLVFTRQDATTITMGNDMAVCCGIWEAGYIDKNTLKILFYDTTMQQAGWKLFIVVDEAVSDTSYSLPTTGAGLSPVSMFIFDVPTGNELNSDVAGSLGTIRINSFDCGPPVTFDLTLDITVASEVQGPPVMVVGTIVGTVYDNPASFGCDFSM